MAGNVGKPVEALVIAGFSLVLAATFVAGFVLSHWTDIEARWVVAGLAGLAIGTSIVIARRIRRLLQSQEAARTAAEKAKDRELRFVDSLVENSAALIMVFEPGGAVLRFNASCERLTGWSRDEVDAQFFWQHIVVPEERAELEEVFHRLRKGESPVRHDNSWRTRDGRELTITWNNTVVRGADGRVLFLIKSGLDMTEQRATDMILRLAASVYQNTNDAILVTDAEGTILSVNPAFTEITGYAADEAHGLNARMLRSDPEGDEAHESFRQQLVTEGRWQGEVWNRRKDRAPFLAWETVSMIFGPGGVPYRTVTVFSDITEVRRKDEALRHFAYHDSLTGLPNRLLFEDRLAKATALAARENRRLAVLMVDLDQFKPVNDRLGHSMGDLVLQSVGRRLVACIRRTDTAARLGGDEFVVILDNPASIGAAGYVADNIVKSLAKPVHLDGMTVRVGASVGVSLYPFDGITVEELVRSADTAMYAAKMAGKNCFRFFDATVAEEAAARHRLEEELGTAIAVGQFELHYQPVISLDDGSVAQCEALLRWRHPDRGLLFPRDFLSLCESSGLIVPLTDLVMAMACRQMRAWRDTGLPGIGIAINLSARNLQDSDLASRIARRLEEAGVESHLLQLELAEQAVSGSPGRAIDEVARLHKLGVRLALDNFGTGCSSLSQLRRLPIDSIKIDRSFVRHVETAQDDAETVRSIVSTGQALHLTTIGEGVETRGQEAFLRACGCSCIQGYLHSRPLPAAQCTAWLQAHGTA